MFESFDDLMERLKATGYFIDPVMTRIVFLAAKLQKPLLLEGPAGSGKTQLAVSVAQAAGTHIERLQCYRGVTEDKAIGHFDESLQRLYMEFSKGNGESGSWRELQANLKGREFFRPGPLMRALECEKPCVLLIDELDKVDEGFDAQAFKRACSCFGLGRYLYRFEETWVHLNQRGEPVAIPVLPAWALPPGVTMAPANGQAVDVRGPVDHKLTAEIEGFRNMLGEHIYAEILRRAGHSRDARTIPNAERQKNVVEWMQATTRGFDRLHTLAKMAGDAQFTAILRNLNITSARHLPSLSALKQLVADLEAISDQQVA
jgi:SpoVK/Ycf46/Vps4 family AAA+-type ATPase